MSQQEYYYEAVQQTTYLIDLKRITNIEDCPEDFLTIAELSEMGLRAHGGKQYFSNKIKNALIEVKASIKPGKKSAIIKDAELLETLKTSYQSCGYFLENTRRVGDRLFYYPQGTAKVQTEPKYADWKTLVWACLRMMNDTYETGFDINVNNSDRVKTIELYKKIFTWEEVAAGMDAKGNNIEWAKMMWEDEKTIPVPSSN